MKKLRLRALSLGAREILNREQLKAISGGCSSDADCTAGYCNVFSGDCVSGGDGSDLGGSGGSGGDNTGFMCADLGPYGPCTTNGGQPGTWYDHQVWDPFQQVCVDGLICMG